MSKKQSEDNTPTDGVAVWTPKPFEGNDLLPMFALSAPVVVEGVPAVVGRDHVDPGDLLLPALSLLQGTSKAVQDRVEGAQAGLFMHTGTEQVLPAGPLRVILAHYHKGNALFPKDDNPRYDGLKTCIAPDGIEGTEYGFCKDCRKCLDWDNDRNEPPLGAETHHFVAFTEWGPCMLRFSRTSYKAGSKFVSGWTMSRQNLWAHPAVVRVIEDHKTLKSGKTTTFYRMQMSWQVTERVPDELQRAAFALYNEVSQKHEHGQLKTQDAADDFIEA
jgi:hypothetical protein